MTDEVVALVKQMAKKNPTEGTERIRRELPKPGLEVGKGTIQKHVYEGCKPGSPDKHWAIFAHTGCC